MYIFAYISSQAPLIMLADADLSKVFYTFSYESKKEKKLRIIRLNRELMKYPLPKWFEEKAKNKFVRNLLK